MAPSSALAQGLNPIDRRYTSHLIDDHTFTNLFAISEADIQLFLEREGLLCRGPWCLKNYREIPTTKTAARIILEAAREFGINPQVILVTLQKENSLITATDPKPRAYQTAMGYGCPDGADCNKDYFGFTNQVRLGTKLLRVGYDRACGNLISYLDWRVHPRWKKDNVVEIDGRQTKLESCATAALYNYTPHRLDSAWRPVDGEYYYGNYNFVTYFKKWFKSDL